MGIGGEPIAAGEAPALSLPTSTPPLTRKAAEECAPVAIDDTGLPTPYPDAVFCCVVVGTKTASPNPTVGLANARGPIGVTAQAECVTAPVASSCSYPVVQRWRPIARAIVPPHDSGPRYRGQCGARLAPLHYTVGLNAKRDAMMRIFLVRQPNYRLPHAKSSSPSALPVCQRSRALLRSRVASSPSSPY